MFLCSFQVELTGLNTVLVQNLSSLSTYLVSVQSHYPQGLSAAIIGNITTCNSLTHHCGLLPDFFFSHDMVTPVCQLLVNTLRANQSLRCSEGPFAFRSEGDSVLRQRDDRALGSCCHRCCVLSHQMDFAQRRSPQTGVAAFPSVLDHNDEHMRMLTLLWPVFSWPWTVTVKGRCWRGCRMTANTRSPCLRSMGMELRAKLWLYVIAPVSH